MQNKLDVLPKNVLFYIFKYLDAKDLFTCACVCKNFLRITNIDELWNFPEISYIDHEPGKRKYKIHLYITHISKKFKSEKRKLHFAEYVLKNFEVQTIYNARLMVFEKLQLGCITNLQYFKNLRALSIRKDKIQHADFTYLPNLCELGIQECEIHEITLGNELKCLELNKNKGCLKFNLKNNITLKNLSIQSNNLTIFPEISHLVNLTKLHIQNEKLIEIPNLQNMRDLQLLFLSQLNLKKPPNISHFEKLQSVSLNGNNFQQPLNLANIPISYIIVDKGVICINKHPNTEVYFHENIEKKINTQNAIYIICAICAICVIYMLCTFKF
jgi:Leucine-rich repeat (LRR) protein